MSEKRDKTHRLDESGTVFADPLRMDEAAGAANELRSGDDGNLCTELRPDSDGLLLSLIHI